MPNEARQKTMSLVRRGATLVANTLVEFEHPPMTLAEVVDLLRAGDMEQDVQATFRLLWDATATTKPDEIAFMDWCATLALRCCVAAEQESGGRVGLGFVEGVLRVGAD